MQQRLTDGQRQAGIATRHGMADSVAFGGVEKQHLVGLGYGLILPQMAHIDAAIRKHQFCSRRELFRTLVPAAAPAVHVSNRNCRRVQ